MTVAMAVKTSDATATLLDESGGSYAGAFQDGDTGAAINSGAGTPTITVDTTSSFANRDTLHAAIATGSWEYVLIEGLDASSWAEIGLSDSVALDGEIGPRILVIDRDLTAGEKTSVESWVMEGLS